MGNRGRPGRGPQVNSSARSCGRSSSRRRQWGDCRIGMWGWFLCGKVYFTPPVILEYITPQLMKLDFFTLELSKTGQNQPLKLFWKIIVNYRKIIKWKINWILMSTSTQWTYNMIYLYIFYSYGEKHKSKVKKICTKAFHIVCSLRRTTNLKSNTIWFFILWFSVIYYDFSKLLQGWLVLF
jgi:hypothetical protein